MEENEMMPSTAEAETPKQLSIDQLTKMLLTETAKWAKFAAILAFVFCGLTAIASLILIFLGHAISTKSHYSSRTGLFYSLNFLFGFIYYLPAKYLYDFSVYIKQAIALDDQESLNYAFDRIKSLYRFNTILMGVQLLFGAIAIISALFILSQAASLLKYF